MKQQYNVVNIVVRVDFRFECGANRMYKLEWLENGSVCIEKKTAMSKNLWLKSIKVLATFMTTGKAKFELYDNSCL